MLDEWGALETSHTIIFARAVLRDIGGAGGGLALDQTPNPDAELIALHAAMVAQGEAVTRMRAEAEDDDILGHGITPQSEAIEAKLGAADDVWLDLADKIAGIPAQTSAGIRLKAEALLNILQEVRDSIDDTIDDIADGNVGELEDRMALSIARDILAGRAVA